MTPFTYARATNSAEALTMGALAGAHYLGGGTNLVDLMRETIEQPGALVDVTRIDGTIEETDGGGLLIGAGVRNTDLAAHMAVRTRYPVLARAILAGASAQIGTWRRRGNLLQRTRCTYFYDTDGSRCNKRSPGQGCDAIDGFNRIHAILGASDQCVATHPSDMCVALAALDAVVHLTGGDGKRAVPFGDFHLLPGDTPQVETVIRPGELITAVELPAMSLAANSTLSQGARPRILRLRADLSGGGAGGWRAGIVRMCGSRWGRGRAQAVARGESGGGIAGQAGDGGELPRCRAGGTGRRAAAAGQRVQIELATRTIVATLTELMGEELA